MRGIRHLVTFTCVAAAVLSAASVASPATHHRASAASTVLVPKVVTPAIVGQPYPPPPNKAMSFCAPVPKAGGACNGHTFKVKSNLPPGMIVVSTNGVLEGVPRKGADLIQGKTATAPGLFNVQICSGALCKPTLIGVFSNFAGTWDGTYQGDPGAFACNTPLSGQIKLILKQKVSIVKGVPTSTVTGTAALTNLPPLIDGTNDGDCTMTDQTFTILANVENPTAAGSDSGNGIIDVKALPNGRLSATMSVQDAQKGGLYSEFTFVASPG